MKLRRAIIGILMVMMPALGSAQGKGKGHDQGHGGGKPAKVNKGNPNVYKGKSVKVRTQQPGVYTGRVKGGPPPWAPAHGYRAKQHVYFPDYRFFYDPYRGGYSYWQNNGWVFSPTVPGFLGGVDLGKARIQLLGDVPLATHPELYYNRYSQMYPARPINISVPIPGR
ncbi:hypothetical protein [Polluticoccus soli]|uniref:hypothetical protein n=1 Tax=Polluticoccus soli TaxID=3034150 RepID=UPI0023E15CE6|nr:hypothetical protein [Flavipsychrobacter sp. JY13-12]